MGGVRGRFWGGFELVGGWVRISAVVTVLAPLRLTLAHYSGASAANAISRDISGESTMAPPARTLSVRLFIFHNRAHKFRVPNRNSRFARARPRTAAPQTVARAAWKFIANESPFDVFECGTLPLNYPRVYTYMYHLSH